MEEQKNNSIDTKHTTITLRDDGIMQFYFKDKTILEVEMLKEALEVTRILGDGKKYPNLILAGDFITVAQVVREFAVTEESNRYTVADAFVVKSLAEKLMVNFYITINRPPKPTRYFNKEEDAIKWLKKFL